MFRLLLALAVTGVLSAQSPNADPWGNRSPDPFDNSAWNHDPFSKDDPFNQNPWSQTAGRDATGQHQIPLGSVAVPRAPRQNQIVPWVDPPKPPAHAGFVDYRTLSIPRKALDSFLDAQKHSEEGENKEAIKDLKKAIKEYPDYYEAYCNLGVQYYREGRVTDALEAFNHAAELGPLDAMIQTNRAAALLVLGETEEAREAAELALQVDPGHLKAKLLLNKLIPQAEEAQAAAASASTVSQNR